MASRLSKKDQQAGKAALKVRAGKKLSLEEEFAAMIEVAESIRDNLMIQAREPDYLPRTASRLVLRPMVPATLAYTVATLKDRWTGANLEQMRKRDPGPVTKVEQRAHRIGQQMMVLGKFNGFADDMNGSPLRDEFRAAILHEIRLDQNIKVWEKHGYREAAALLKLDPDKK